jgi:hypothetical protein
MRIDDANLPEPRQRCEGRVPESHGYGYVRCSHVATVTAKGKRLCLVCAKKVK